MAPFSCAVKCNPDPRIISTLHAAGAGFDCASLSEIEAALGAGADPSVDVIYANPCKGACRYAITAAVVAVVVVAVLALTQRLAQLLHTWRGLETRAWTW